MASLIGLAKRNWQVNYPPEVVAKIAKPLKFGILGAADIGPQALIKPARTHPDVVVHAVAARDQVKAEAYAKKHGIAVVKGTYQGRCTNANAGGVLTSFRWNDWNFTRIAN